MDFNSAIKNCLITKYGNFTGVATRSEFWWFFLFSFIAGSVGNILSLGLHTELFSNLVWVLLLLPSLSVAARRLHDVGYSAWWLLLQITIVGIFFLFYLYLKTSKTENNKYR